MWIWFWQPAPTQVEKLGAPDKTFVVGNPVRPEVLTADRQAARSEAGCGRDRTVILSFGGSLGADRINEVVADLCAWEKQQGANVLHLPCHRQRGVILFNRLEREKGFAPVPIWSSRPISTICPSCWQRRIW